MNILFLSLLKFSSFDERNIYTDLLRELIKNGHNVYAVCPLERRFKEKPKASRFGDSSIITVKTLNIQKTSILEKGIGMLLIKGQFIRRIKRCFKSIKFDLILYPTPPITLYGVVRYFKNRDKCRTYLMLKDIFPQGAVDLGALKKTGLKGLIYKHFRKQEKKFYEISDRIGCMSPANAEYVLKHNPEIDEDKVEIFPNCIEVQGASMTENEKEDVRIKYGLPLHKKIFVYGGNLGKPQGVPFIIDCLKAEKENDRIFFLIVGDGTEYNVLNEYLNESKQGNFKLLRRLPSDEFDRLLACCDVGLIFLDHRFTIPNIPSRLLSYLQASLPVLACTDVSSDLGRIIMEGGFGWWCESDNPDGFCNLIADIDAKDIKTKGRAGVEFLKSEYSVSSNLYKLF